MSLSRFLFNPVRQVGPTAAALTGSVNSGITTGPASPTGAKWMWAASRGRATFWVVMASHRVRALRSMVMVAVPVPGPPQVPGAVGQTSAAPDSWMVKVAVLGSARAPPAVMTVPTALRAIVMTAMMTSRLPIELLLRWAGRRYPAAANSNGRPDELVTVLPDTTSSASNAPGNVSSLTEPVPAQRPPCQARTLGGELQADRDDSPRAGGDQRGEDG